MFSLSRPYDKDNPRDSAWRASVYQAALAGIVPILRDLGGTARHNEICRSFAQRFPELCDDDIYQPSSGTYPQWKHTIAAAEQVLKKQGDILLADGMWMIGKGNSAKPSADRTVHRPNFAVQRSESVIGERIPVEPTESLITETESQNYERDLPDRLLERVLELTPEGFERLIGSLLSKLGFVNVDLTGGPHDRGIDGRFEINLVGLRLAFQAKRYQPGNIIRAREIRDFRGAMVANQQAGGLFITTSSFTDEARMEADAPGPVISLVDGKRFVEVMIQNNVGIRDVVVDADIDDQFFRDL